MNGPFASLLPQHTASSRRGRRSPSYQTPSSPIPSASGDTPLAAARRDVVGLPRAAGDRLRALPGLRPHRHRQRGLHLPHRVGALPLPPPPPPPELPETLTLTRRLVCSVACRWAGEAEPRVSFRNIVQRPRHRSSGTSQAGRLEISTYVVA